MGTPWKRNPSVKPKLLFCSWVTSSRLPCTVSWGVVYGRFPLFSVVLCMSSSPLATLKVSISTASLPKRASRKLGALQPQSQHHSIEDREGINLRPRLRDVAVIRTPQKRHIDVLLDDTRLIKDD